MMPERVARIGIGYAPRHPRSREVSFREPVAEGAGAITDSGISGGPEDNAGAGKRCAGGSPG